MDCIKDQVVEQLWNNRAWSELRNITQQCAIGARYRNVFKVNKVKYCDSSVISLDG